MRKIQSPQEIEKRKKRNMVLLSVFMLAVLVFGTVEYGFASNRGGTQDNGTEGNAAESGLTSVGDQWALNFQGQVIYFTNSLDSTRNTTLNTSKTLSGYSRAPLYISSDNPSITNELRLSLGRFTPRLQEACYLSCPEKDLPEKNCTDNLIIWKDSFENRVYEEENCVFIEGDLRAVDAFLYELFGVGRR